jgi:predicted acetyltransferase
MTFGEHARDADVASERLVFEPDRSLAVFDGERQVAGTMACTFRMTVPGGDAVPTAGITSVGVLPTHRRRGILTSLMREQLEDVHRRGEPLAALWASESAIYGRFGYGMAAFSASVEIERPHTAFGRPIDPPEGARLVGRDEALRLFPGIYERTVRNHPGMVVRNDAWWDYTTTDHEHWRDGASEYFYAVLEEAGRPEGYAYYRIKQDWSGMVPSHELQLAELGGTSPRIDAQLWRYCLGVDLVSKVRADHRPADEALFFLLADPRRLKVRLLDGLYVRVVDVAAALAARTYRVSGRLTVEVRDPFCPWNDGRYELDAGPDGATCEPTEAEPDVVVDATSLGALYLGGVPATRLSKAFGIEERRTGALAEADLLFGSDVAPWCPFVF